MVRVSTSILTQEKEDAVKTFYDLEVAHTDMFHIDVMDGKFVEKNTIELMKDYATTLSHITNLGLDVHFMVENIEEFIDEYIDLNPEYISFHIETSKTKERTMEIINTIKENDIKVAIAINPDTSIEDIKEYIPYVHMVLVMTVVPGKGGQKLIPETLDKVSELKKFIEEKYHNPTNFIRSLKTKYAITDNQFITFVDNFISELPKGKYEDLFAVINSP